MPRRQFSRGVRRKTQWGGFGHDDGTVLLPAAIAIAANASAILSQQVVVAGTTGFIDEEVTITRMIGRVSYMINNVSASSQASWALGCYIARQEAITAGLASLPDPEQDPDAEWLYWASGIAINGTDVLRNAMTSGSLFNFDVKGQRVMGRKESPVWIAHVEGAGCLVGVSGRYLVKLT